MKCRHCSAALELTMVDLGTAPPSNAYLAEEQLQAAEAWYPLRVLVCERCWLVQTADFLRATELFNADYAYLSGVSSSWVRHCERYVAGTVRRFGLDRNNRVVEVAANDGTLLEHVKTVGIPCIGIEPTANSAAVARKKGIEIIEDFFGVRLAGELVTRGEQADLIVANNVLAHVPDVNDFIAAFAMLLRPDGVATFEFPHLLQLIEKGQFDTIYHEHFSYLSLTAVVRLFEDNGLTVFDVEEHSTHGGSLRVFAQRSSTGRHRVEPTVQALLQREAIAGVTTASYYAELQAMAERIKDDFLSFLI
jgi:SAM-dependent methyltransferase